MGNQMFIPSPQPGTTQLDTEPAECSSGVPCKNRIWDDNMPKPPAAAGWTESRWRSFAAEMGELVRTYKRDGYAGYALLLIPLGIVTLLVSFVIPDMIMRGVIHVPFIILSLVLCFGLSGWLKPANEAVDRKIEALCQRYSDGAVTLQYVTMYTGVCKPKGTLTYRSLWVSPGGGGGTMGQAMVRQPVAQAVVPQAGTLMAVTCPPGCGAGDTVAIATPSGQQVQVQIPTGVVAGQVFNVQLPAAPPVVSAVAIPMGGHAA